METIVVDEFLAGEMGYVDDMGYMEGMEYMDDVSESTQVPLGEKLMSSWVFVGGVTAAVLALGVLLGLLSAKRKIKKGIDLYEG